MTPLRWLFVLVGLVSLDARIIPPILPAIATTLGVTAGEAGFGVTAYTFAYGLMQVVYGPLSDRIGRIRVIRLTALVFAIGTALTAFALSLGAFAAARLVTGVFAAATIPTTFAYIGDTVHYAERQKVILRSSVIVSSAQALSATLAGTVTHFVSWRVLFAAYAVLTLAALAAMRARPEAPRAVPAARVRYVDILRTPGAPGVYAGAWAEGVFIWGGSTYMGVLADHRYGLNDLQIGLVLACYRLGTIAGGLWAGRLLARLGERTLAAWGGLVQLAGFAVLAAPVPWPAFVAGLFTVGLGFAGLHTMIQTRATELVPAARGKAFSLFPLAFFVGGAIGTATFGRLVDAGKIALVMAICGVGLAAVGQLAARTRITSRRAA